MTSGPTRDTVYLVDAYSLIFQVFHALPEMSSPSGLPTNALFGFTKDMLFLRDERQPTHLIAIFDAPGKTFRDEVYTEYKAHRAAMPDDLALQIPLIQEMLEAMRIPSLALEGFEADDLIATLAVAGAEQGFDIAICSSDKDCRQLLSEHVKIFNIRKQDYFDEADLLRDWGVKPGQVIDYQTLVGDSVDNVPGVNGVGPKTASKYLQDFGTLDNLVKHVDELPGKKKDNLRAALPLLEMSRRLVTLDTRVPMTLEWDAWRVQPWDGPRLLDLFRGWGFHRFAEQVRSSLKAVPAPPARPAAVQGNLFGPAGNGASKPAAAEPAAVTTRHHVVDTPAELERFLTLLGRQKRFALDLLTTAFDPQTAQLVGLAFSWETGVGWYLPLRGPAGATLLDEAEVLAQLRPILESADIEKVNQNIKYDYQVLKSHGIYLAGIAGDTMVADYLLAPGERAHGLDVLAERHLTRACLPLSDLLGKGKNQLTITQVPVERIAECAVQNADLAWSLDAALRPLLAERGFTRAPAVKHALYDDLEIPLIEVLGDMEFTGVRLDVPLLAKMSGEMDTRLRELERDIYRLAGHEFAIGSVVQLRKVLFEEMQLKPEKRTAIGGAASTDQETLESLARQGHELPRLLLEHRKIAKLKGTYVDALPALVNPRTGRVHASFNQTVAATGRLSSSDPNLQNVPIRSELGEQIRQAFVPEPGWLLVTADYSQIELRLLAHLSGDEQLKHAFAENRDVHARVAAQIFGSDERDVTAEQRRMAKTVNFGVVYGISPFGLAQRLQIPKEDAAKFIDAYFARYPWVLEYQEKLLTACRRHGYVSTILGRRRMIQGVRERTSYRQRNQPEREAINMGIQGSAADLIKVAMLNIQRRLKKEGLRSRLLLQIHDELVFEAPPDEREAIVTLVREEMTWALAEELTVPLGVDLGVGPNWLETEDVADTTLVAADSSPLPSGERGRG